MLFCTLNYTRIILYFILAVHIFKEVCRWRIFRKMGAKPWKGLFPGIREFVIYRKCWKAWPYVLMLIIAIVSALIPQIAPYFDINIPIPTYIRSNLMTLSLVCFMIITVNMYRRLAFSFGHGVGFIMGLLFLNPVFLGIMAFSKNEFNEECARYSSREYVRYRTTNNTLRQKLVSVVSMVVIACSSIGYIGHVILTEQQPGFLITNNLESVYGQTSGKVSGDGEVIYPAMESGAAEAAGEPGNAKVRDLFFPDKSDVSEATVYMYLVGSNLEDSVGSASINLWQIKDATAAGSNLRFIIEAGGTGRWFTKGFKFGRTARYLIQNGEITLLETLPRNVSMSDSDTLADFLDWANKNYPSDRKMLFFWDHGGALGGFGRDIINQAAGSGLMSMSDIEGALKSSGGKYDLIAFDACYMHTLEVGMSLEPYADYLLASAESEPGSGMYYTAAFSELGRNPGMSTKEFGAMMCSSYDQSLDILNGYAPPGFTLSMTELRYLPEVHKAFTDYLKDVTGEFRTDKDSFVSMASARSKAYEYQMDDQIDLMDFVDQSDIPDDLRQSLKEKINRAIVVRSAGSANHINGLAVYMPYNNLDSYTKMNKQLNKLGMKSEAKAYNDFASVIGSQKNAKDARNDYGADYYKLQPWYVDDFENYISSLYKQDVKLTQDGDQYTIGLTEEEWSTITGYTQGLKIKVGDRYADLGSDDLYDRDSKGHYALEFDHTWVSINDVLVALHPGTPKESEEISVYTGTVDAMLNFTTPITIYLEWVNIGDVEGEGKVLGYLPADEDADDFYEYGMPRGYKQFKSNNIITFLYDWYDEDGDYLLTAIGHLPIMVGESGLTVKQKDIRSEEYIYYGILKDVANRTIQTETLHHAPEE